MKRQILSVLILGLTLPAPTYAQDAGPAEAGCPAMMTGMEKQIDEMMGDVSGMMGTVKDGPMKQKLSKMHDRMALMNANMQKMHGMMGRGMMMHPGETAKPATPDHDAHHTNP